MKMVTAIIKPFKLDDVREALYRGAEYTVDFLPKVKLEIAIAADQVDAVIGAISASAKSDDEGKIGDGKIFVASLDEVVRIRTGETGSVAL